MFEISVNIISEKVDFAFGEWVQNLTAGGQISHNSFDRNPQYGLSITGEKLLHTADEW